jgi:hypothetical protein
VSLFAYIYSSEYLLFDKFMHLDCVMLDFEMLEEQQNQNVNAASISYFC